MTAWYLIDGERIGICGANSGYAHMILADDTAVAYMVGCPNILVTKNFCVLDEYEHDPRALLWARAIRRYDREMARPDPEIDAVESV